ncbi:MAG: SpoIIE family protein phosphatase [Planctomycetaceae bacterium]
MPSEPVRLPRSFVLAIAVLCVAPFFLNLCGLTFEFSGYPSDIASLPPAEQIYFHSPYFQLRGALVHTLMEWTSVCLAIVIAVCSFSYYTIKKDAATPIIGTALLFSGLLDAFHILAADGLILRVTDNENFVPFVWGISRIFHASILMIGTGLFVLRSHDGRRPKPRGVRFIITVSVFYGLVAYLVIQICAVAPALPQTIFPGAPIVRPLDAVALVIYLFAGGFLFPRFHRLHPSLFSYGLFVSLLPYLFSQAYAALASDAQYDNALNISQYLKIIAQSVPLAGLLFDYNRAYQAEAVLAATEEKLRIAREIQRGLLPQCAPPIPGFDVAGFSSSAGAVGGDYYDFVHMPDGAWGLVIADVSGHDLGASILMSQTRAYLRAEASNRCNVSEIVTRLNHFLSYDVRDRRFVSFFFARLDPAQRSLVYAAAGQNGHLLKPDGSVTTLDVTGPLLGVIDEPQPASPEVFLAPGDLMILFTDGIAEAASPHGEQFGNERIFNAVRDHRDQSTADILDAVEKAVLAFRCQVPLEDDVTMLVLRCIA